jgi:hypothetical protein
MAMTAPPRPRASRAARGRFAWFDNLDALKNGFMMYAVPFMLVVREYDSRLRRLAAQLLLAPSFASSAAPTAPCARRLAECAPPHCGSVITSPQVTKQELASTLKQVRTGLGVQCVWHVAEQSWAGAGEVGSEGAFFLAAISACLDMISPDSESVPAEQAAQQAKISITDSFAFILFLRCGSSNALSISNAQRG